VRDLGRGVLSALDAVSARAKWASQGAPSKLDPSGGSSSARGGAARASAARDGGRGAGNAQGGWSAPVDVMEDPSGRTVVKDQAYIEVRGVGWGG